MSNHIFATGDVLVYALVVVTLLFMGIYNYLARWERTPEGRNVMLFTTALLAVFTLNALAVMFGPDYPGRGVLRVLVYGGLIAAFVDRIRLVISVQRRARKKRRADNTAAIAALDTDTGISLDKQ